MVFKNLERKVGSIEKRHLPQRFISAIEDAQATYDSIQSSPHPIKTTQNWTRQVFKVTQEVIDHAGEPFISQLRDKGVTHAYWSRTGLHFVRLPEKHRGKLYTPLVGKFRIPIQKEPRPNVRLN